MDELSSSFSEGLSIYHCNIIEDNFLIDTATNRFWMINFRDVGVLPKVFQTFALFNCCNTFAATIGRKLGYKPSKIANRMVYASTTLQQTGMNAKPE